ncbi:MAG: hypothetical protein JW942_09250, partial [Opitutales bacterium]|nr:hypothetical protein [Opitutales bacterium]
MDHLGEGAVSVLLTEDGLGRMVAIDNGVLMVFDGNAWSSRLKLGTTGADSIIVARMGLDGRYYAGTVGMWGQLHCDEDGDFVFRYNQSEAPDWTSAAHFDEIAVTSKGVFFYSTLGTVFQEYWTGKCKYWNDKVPIDLIFEHKERVYMSLGSGGVYSLEGDDWVVVPGTEHMTSSDAIMRMEPLDEGRALLVSHSGRLYAFDGQVLEPFASDSEELLAKGVVDMERLLSGDYAFAIRGYGILVLDKNGHQIMRLGVDHDETFASISDLYQQENGILWASMPSGISKVYYPSQVSFFDYRFDIPVQWPEVYHFRDKLMIYSDYRIFLSNYDAVGQISSFEEVKIQGVDLIESCIGYGDEIIFGSGGSIFTYDMKSPPRLIMEGISSARICELNEYEGYLMVFGNDKHALLHRVNGNWVVVQTLPSMGFPAVVLQTNDGEMWVEHGLGRVCRIWSENGRMEYQNFERIEGMDNAWLNVWEYRGQVYLCTGPVIRRFERETGRIVPAPEMDGFIKTLGATVSRVFEGPDGTVWASGQQGVTLLRTIDGKTVVDRETLRPVSEAHSLVRFDGDQIVWLLSRNRVVRFNAAQGHPKYNELFPRLGHTANLISSSGEREIITLGDDERTRTILPYEKNNITLRLFPNTYSLPSPPMYRYRLSGVNSSWSSPFKEPILSFTNLREGDYRLDIEMLYQGLSVGAVSSFHFEIEPPWMRTWWAYVSYFFSSVALILIIVRISQRHNERERRRLEGLVNSRTKELDQTNSRLRESIKSAMAAAEAKSRFLANMSHEIRTPMNGVVGTTELLIRTPLSDEQKELVDIINKSGNLLLGIVNDVLDYSKIEADQLVFELIPLRPQSLVDDVLEILSERANEKHVEFFGSVAPECPVEFIGDSTRLQQVLVNLASNALKFTEHGEVEIRGWSEKREDGRWELHFSVRDTGIGMDPKRMNRLFKAFSQLDASNTRVYGGTGLGLAISK